MKTYIKRFLQFILGFERYLFYFSRYIVASMHHNRKEGDFLFFRDLLKNGDTVLDIGANIGAMSVHLSRKLPDSLIYAFEPVPVNVKTLKRIIKHYGLTNIKVMECAVGEKADKVEMVLPRQKRVRMHGLSHVVHESINEFNEGDRFEVPMISLDSLEELFTAKSVGGIKLDVENFEFFVLKGADTLIRKFRPIIYTELWENENRHHCFEWIKERNYDIKILELGKLVLFDPAKHHTQNFFFIPAY
jgi:FkbM family methyltransferase